MRRILEVSWLPTLNIFFRVMCLALHSLPILGCKVVTNFERLNLLGICGWSSICFINDFLWILPTLTAEFSFLLWSHPTDYEMQVALMAAVTSKNICALSYSTAWFYLQLSCHNFYLILQREIKQFVFFKMLYLIAHLSFLCGTRMDGLRPVSSGWFGGAICTVSASLWIISVTPMYTQMHY